MKKLAEEWLRFADKDIKTIDYILQESELTNIVAFHSHQCLEKSFKAIIVLNTENIPRIHNLLKLYGTVRNYYSLSVDMNILEQINETYIDARYPSDLGLLPEGSLSHEKAVLFFEETKRIYFQIKEIICKTTE